MNIVATYQSHSNGYEINLNESPFASNPEKFRKRVGKFNFIADQFMGVCLSNPDHSVTMDVEDTNNTLFRFDECDKDFVEKILGVDIILKKQ